MKIVLLAEACNPAWASLPGFSYSLANSIAKHVDVVLVTHIRNKEEISKIVADNFKEIIYIDNEYIASPLYKFSKFLKKIGIGGFMTSMALKYPGNIAFEYEVYKQLKERINNKEFDFIHRISPVSPTVPSPIAKWADIPFIYGPLNGSLPWPTQFRDEIKKERELLVHVRNFYKLLPYYKSSFTHATKILAAFKHVEKDIPVSEHNKIVRFNELGVDTELYKPKLKEGKNKKQCRFLFVGRLVPYKCARVVISAFINSQELRDSHHLDIVGDGPERKPLQKLIDDNKLNECIKILGWKTQEEVATCMADSDVFVFPTIREVGGNVILEALSAGLPVIVPNYGGPAELVDDKVGVKIPLADKEPFLQTYIESMELLAKDNELRESLSTNARKTALKLHSWEMKGLQMKEIYDSITK